MEEHVCLTDSVAVAAAYRLIDSCEDFPSSFAHGDLTLENVLIENDGGIVLIDPNFKANLFQSYLLDLGKLMQSVHSDYHRVFNSHPGCDPTYLCEYLRLKVGERNWVRGLIAELTHLIRLRKYRPEREREVVDQLLERAVCEIDLLS
jgi:thiamine kinase-like enzyme